MIVITTPNGTIGHQVLANVVDSGQPVRVFARDPLRLSPQVRKSIEIVEGSHGDRDVVEQALEDADSVFWLVPPNPRAQSFESYYVDFMRPTCDAFRSQGVRRAVGVSAPGRGWPRNAGLVSASLAMDDLIASVGVSYRALAFPSFMDNLLRQVEPIGSQGMFFSPISGDRKVPTCATRDIATAAAKLLLDRSWSGTGSVPVLGPEDLSCNDMAHIMSEVLKNEGVDNSEPRTREATTPSSFREWREESVEAGSPAR